MKSQPKERKSEGSTCNCKSPAEHRSLVLRINESYKRDPGRAAQRNARTTAFLRAQVTKELNGG